MNFINFDQVISKKIQMKLKLSKISQLFLLSKHTATGDAVG